MQFLFCRAARQIWVTPAGSCSLKINTERGLLPPKPQIARLLIRQSFRLLQGWSLPCRDKLTEKDTQWENKSSRADRKWPLLLCFFMFNRVSVDILTQTDIYGLCHVKVKKIWVGTSSPKLQSVSLMFFKKFTVWSVSLQKQHVGDKLWF